jgi:hypothetical protein
MVAGGKPARPTKKARHSSDEQEGNHGGGTPRQDGRHGKQDNLWDTEETQQKTKAKKPAPAG